MSEASLGQKISWFLFQKGMGVVKPDYLFMVKFADPQWFQLADTLIKDKNFEGREIILDQILLHQNLKNHPKRNQFLQIVALFLSKGILDERRRVAKYIEENVGLFTTKDEAILGHLMTAQRDSDTVIANTAESALKKLKGEE